MEGRQWRDPLLRHASAQRVQAAQHLQPRSGRAAGRNKAPAENPACTTARNNIALLNSKQNVRIDSNGDGKPDKALSDSDRANQLALAQATLNASCSSSPAGG